MIISYSPGAILYLANTGSFKDMMANGAMYTFPGTMPLRASDGVAATSLGLITVDGNTWTPGSPVNGLNVQDAAYANGDVRQFKTADVWQLNCTTSGVPGFVRFVANPADDITQESFTHPRIDILVTQTGGILNIRATSVVAGQKYSVDSFNWLYARSK